MHAATATPREDTPRAAFGLFSWRVNAAIVAVLLAVALAAWRSTVEDAFSMRGMVMGLGQVGWLAQGDMTIGVFMAMWITMMAAMMLPTVAPMVLAHRAVARRRGGGNGATLAFVAGYLLVWSAIGLLPLLAYKGIARLDDVAAQSTWLRVLAGAVLVVAGGYQFTRWKRACFEHCQSPLGFIATHDFGAGAIGDLRAGAVHGAFCIGCCWALTAVLLVVGLMNLVWMTGIFAVFLAEKTWRRGLLLARTVGAALMILGLAVALEPALLPAISL